METITLPNQPDDSFGVWSSPPLQSPLSRSSSPGDGTLPLMCLDAAILGDIPARYTIPCVSEYFFPAMGVYVDRRIVPGFRYRVKILPGPETGAESGHYLFGGVALCLKDIGRGYSRRLVFESGACCSNDKENIFWTDSHPGGVALELETVAPGDSFHVLSSAGVLLGRCEVINVLEQEELSQDIGVDFVRKRVSVQLNGQIRWLDYSKNSSAQKLSGIVECVKKKGSGGKIIKICLEQDDSFASSINAAVTLVPCQTGFEAVTVGSIAVGGIPTTYRVKELLDSEYPVIGTYVDPRIVPGLKYLVRRLGSQSYLFGGRALRLISIGQGYAKRITFQPDAGTLNEPDNFFWSDSISEGYAFQPVAVDVGVVLKLVENGCVIGKLQVIRIPSRQRETEKRLTPSAVECVFEVDLLCQWISKTEDYDVQDLIRVTGTAFLVKSFQSKSAVIRLIRDLCFLRPSSFIQKNKYSCHFLPV